MINTSNALYRVIYKESSHENVLSTPTSCFSSEYDSVTDLKKINLKFIGIATHLNLINYTVETIVSFFKVSTIDHF